MLEEMTHTSFEALVGESINLKAGEVSFQANIESVKLLRQNPGQKRQPFSVELQAHEATNHGQQMYQLSHLELGDLSLFLVPVGPGEHCMCYQIVFN
jgi:hypothetical protein